LAKNIYAYQLGAREGKMKKVILVEFNELCPALLDRWMAGGHLPNFSRLHQTSDVFVTQADATEPVNLEPWIQWYSIHTGLPFEQHNVFHLTDGPRAGHPDIWSVLHDSGKTVWNCSSMNARQFAYPGSAYLPDPWCTSEQPNPPELGVFHRFVSHQVREYSNSDQRLGFKGALEFVMFMLRHGLRSSTVMAVLKQYLSEFQSAGKTTWRRAVLQDRFLFDLFSSYFKKLNPDFSTFFANSTAHLQHSFWRHMEPEKFTVKPSEQELEQYKDSVFFGYVQMDRLLGDLMQLAGSETRLVFATALSQQPYLKYEHVGGHNFYRPRSIENLFAQLGLKAQSLQPVMTHQYLATFAEPAQVQAARQALESLMVDGKPIFGFDDAQPGALYRDTAITSDTYPALNTSFFDHFYKIEGLKSGRHHPDGCLWIQSGSHRKHEDKVSILDILPTVAKLLNVPVNGYPGRALL
jgi:hypothetical protein